MTTATQDPIYGPHRCTCRPGEGECAADKAWRHRHPRTTASVRRSAPLGPSSRVVYAACAYCGATFVLTPAQWRAQAGGRRLYCRKACASAQYQQDARGKRRTRKGRWG